MAGNASAGVVVWFTGLPSSGKSTLAARVSSHLRDLGTAFCILDGDEVRAALRPTPGYSDTERRNFYDSLARLASLLASQGLTVLVPATAHLRAYRQRARELAPRFIEVHVASALGDCVTRDTKQLYSRALAGELALVPGKGVDYEPPKAPDVVAEGGHDSKAALGIAEAIVGRQAFTGPQTEVH